MRYISLFSGIEAATVAWEPLGWEPVAFSEIEPYCCRLLAERYPDVPNLGDITKIDWEEVKKSCGTVNVVVGGSPCQSFSVAGKREGLRGQSGLMFEYIRAVQALMPEFFVWENVPGALSVEGGAAFGQLLREMADLGYGLAWRVLDAQFFDVAQRRERVFLVGSLGTMRCAEVLFDEEGLRRDYKTGRAKRKQITADLEAGYNRIHSYAVKLRHTGTENVGGGSGALAQTEVSGTIGTQQDQTLIHDQSCLTPWDGQAQRVFDPYSLEAAPTLSAAAAETGTPSKTIVQDIAQYAFSRGRRPKSQDDYTQWVPSDVACTLNTFDVGETRANEVVCMTGTQQNSMVDKEICGTLTRTMEKDVPAVLYCVASDTGRPMVDDSVCGALHVGGGTPIIASAACGA